MNLIDRIADDGAALSDQDRQRIDKTARSELLELGHIEEQLVMMAEDVGQTIDRRRDCDPRCVLGVVGPEPK